MNDDQELANFAVITVLNDLIAVESVFLEEVQQASYAGSILNATWTAKLEERRLLFKELQASLDQFMNNISIKTSNPHGLSKVLLYVKEGLTGLWDKIIDIDAVLEQMECILSMSYYAFVEFFGKDQLYVRQSIPLSENEMIMVAKCLIDEPSFVA